MAFSYTITSQTVFGDKRVVYGTFTNAGGSSGGDIETGLRIVDQMILQHTGSAVVTDAPIVNETMPCTGTVTIVTVADKSGTFLAIGV